MTILRYTADQLIPTVRLRAGLANSGQQGANDASILQILNECMHSRLVPGVIKVRENYFATSKRYTIANTRGMRIPPRAVGQKLLDLYWVSGDGARTVLPPVDRGSLNVRQITTPTPGGFYIEGNQIILTPDRGTYSGTLEVSFFIRPGDLVLEAMAGTVQSVNTADKMITLSAAPPATFNSAAKYDVHSKESGSEVKQLEIQANDLTGNVLTFDDAIDGSTWGSYTPVVGDYVCLTREAALPGLPAELHVPLALMAAITILSTINPVLAERKGQELSTMLSLAGYIVDSRVELKPQRIVSHRPMG